MGTALRISSLASKTPVLIVGGGLAGFTAALSLHRAGIQNKIVMPETKFTQHPRSGVFLTGSAIRILDRLGLGSHYRTLGIPVSQLDVEDTRGRSIISIPLDRYGTEIWTVPRDSLQQLFLEAIPPDSVHADTRFRSLYMEDNSVHVQVEKGTRGLALSRHPVHAVSSFDTKFVIGADGINSGVRTFMSRPVMTVPSGTMIWRAVVRNRDVESFPRHIGKEVWDTNRRFGFVRMNQDEVVWWGVASNFDEVILRPFSRHLYRVFKGFPKCVTDLISSVDSDREIYRAELKRVWPAQFPWVDDAMCRIALVGDAGRPDSSGNFHIGHTLAVEDSYLLAKYLAEQNEKGLLTEGPRLDGYAESRESRTRMTSQVGDRLLSLSAASSAVSRFVSKKFFWLSIERLAAHGSATIGLTRMPESSKVGRQALKGR